MGERTVVAAHDRTQHAFWVKLMNDLEASARTVAKTNRDGHPAPEGWQPPQTPGPIPVELMQRAREVLVSHLDAVGDLEARRNSTLAHLAAVRSVTDAASADRAVYLDVAG